MNLFYGVCLSLIIILVIIGLVTAYKSTPEQLRIKKLISEGYKFFEYKKLFYNRYINTNIISEHSGYFKDENDLRSYVEVGGTKLKWFREYKSESKE